MSSIFICHSSADKPFVRILKSRLEKLDGRVWVDEDEIRPGASLIGAISNGIDEMDYLGVVLSPKSVRSKWVREELEIALIDQIQKSEIRVIPILLRDCDVPSFLKGKKYTDFSGWSKSRNQEKRWSIFDKAAREVASAMDLDPNDEHRWSGRTMIKLIDLRKRIANYFAPKTAHIEILDDESGINFIRVDNGDATFQMYEYWSKPSYLDIINDVFNMSDSPITDISFVETIAWTQDERSAAVDEICKAHNISREEFWDHTHPDREKTGYWGDYQKWLLENSAISLVRVGDFGSKR